MSDDVSKILGINQKRNEAGHNEANLYIPKINAVIAKVSSIEEIPQELLDYAHSHNLPIYLLGE